MSGTVIFLTIVGLALIIISFLLGEKMREDAEKDAEISIPNELSEEKKQQIDKLISDYMDEKVEDRMAGIESRLSELVNEKTLALGDYAVTVNEEIERNHKEVLFLYSMLSDKQKEVMTTAGMVDEVKKDAETLIASAAETEPEEKPAKQEPKYEQPKPEHGKRKRNRKGKKDAPARDESKTGKEAPAKDETETEAVSAEEDTSFYNEPAPEENTETGESYGDSYEDEPSKGDYADDYAESEGDAYAGASASKDVILQMHKQGLSILEIAKHLGLGVGEVKLVVDLSEGGRN